MAPGNFEANGGHFGASLLCDISPESLTSWLINLPLADRSKNRHRGYAHQIFDDDLTYAEGKEAAIEKLSQNRTRDSFRAS